MKAPLVIIFFTLVLGLSAACGGNNNQQAGPSPVLVTENFTGTLNPMGTAMHTFTVNYGGNYSDASITINSLTAVSDGSAKAITIGVGFGNVNVGVCTLSSQYTNPAAPLNTELATSVQPFIAGPYCVQVFDNPASPTVPEPLTYAITVKHF